MKRTKKLISLLAVLVLILCATLAVNILSPENEPEKEEVETVVFSVVKEEVKELGWDYSEEILFKADNGSWVYEEDNSFPVDTSYLDQMLAALAEITSSKTIEDVEDWDQYGLEVPVCTITVTTDTTHTLSIGLETSIGGERYFSNGDGNAYLVDANLISYFSYGLYDVLKYESIPNMENVTSLEVVSDAQNYQVTYRGESGLAYSDTYVWFLGDKVLDTELTEDLISTVTDLSWSECVNFNAEDFSLYGLDTPDVTVTINYVETLSVSTDETDADGNTIFETRENPEAFILEISEVNDTCYARIKGSNMVYTIDGSVLDTLLYTSYYELQPDEVISMDWDALQSADITLDGETYELVKNIRSTTDEDGNTTEETFYILDGEEVDAKAIWDALDAISSTGYAAGLTPERGEEIRIVFHRNHETYPEVELVFYQYDSSACLTTLNGTATVFADRKAVVALVEEVNSLVLG